jgi:hypothetical protein
LIGQLGVQRQVGRHGQEGGRRSKRHG